MPKPNEGESEQDYMGRCIPMAMEDGTAKDRDQAAAICYGKFREHSHRKRFKKTYGEE